MIYRQMTVQIKMSLLLNISSFSAACMKLLTNQNQPKSLMLGLIDYFFFPKKIYIMTEVFFNLSYFHELDTI